MGKKAAIGLSMNIIVILIISIVILVAGVAFLYNLIEGAESIKSDLDERTHQQLKQLLIDQGKRTAVYPYKVTVLRGDNDVFGIGVLNVDIEEPSNAYFTLEVTPSKVLDEQGNDITNNVNLEELQQESLLYDADPFNIEQHEHKNVPVLVSVPSNYPQGTYIFNADVTVDGNPYPPSQKFYVEAR